MYHPTTMGALAQARHDDLRREAAGTWRLGRAHTTGNPRPPMLAHPRLVTAAVTLLVTFGFVALT